MTTSRIAPHAPRALLLVLSAAALASCAHNAGDRAQAVPVVTATAVVRPTPFEIDANGTVEPIQTVAILPQISGTVLKIAFREGDDVTAGQTLFQIDPRPYQAALALAEATLGRDAAQAASAVENARRYEALAKKDYVAAQQSLDQRAAADALLATLRADSAAVRTARLNLEYATIRAPITGRTGRLLVHEGDVVRTNATTPLVVINQIRPIRVRFAVPERSLPAIQHYRAHDLKVLVLPAGGDSTTLSDGLLTFVDNAVDTASGTVLLKAEFPNRDEVLWPGEFVGARLILYVDTSAIVVPAQAIMSGQQGPYVFTISLNDSTAHVQPVTVARSNDTIAVIAQGISAGQVVVTDGQLKLFDKARVEITRGVSSAPTDSTS
jgi:membrane fusion protein, multidrug efflux system